MENVFQIRERDRLVMMMKVQMKMNPKKTVMMTNQKKVIVMMMKMMMKRKMMRMRGIIRKRRKTKVHSALDKLLSQLGIYATWLSSIAYLQKQLRIFIYFLRRIFFSVITPFLIA